jgi:hypothetical protein
MVGAHGMSFRFPLVKQSFHCQDQLRHDRLAVKQNLDNVKIKADINAYGKESGKSAGSRPHDRGAG